MPATRAQTPTPGDLPPTGPDANPPQPPGNGTNSAMITAITKLTDVLDAQKPRSSTTPTVPKMGTLIEEDGVKVFEMGGVPDVDWTQLVEHTKWKHSGQIRSLDKSKTHRLLSSMPALDPPWQKKQRLTVLQEHLITQAGNFGMQQNCYIQHPTKPEMVNIVEHPHVYSSDLALLVQKAEAQIQKYDRYDSENDRALRKVILDSVEPTLRQQVSGLSDLNDGALVTWIKIVREWSIMTREKSAAVMELIKSTKIQSFNGMNVSDAVDHLRPLCASLYDTRDYDPLVLEPFLMSLHSAFPSNSPEHLSWWGDIHKLIVRLQTICATQKMHQQLGPCQIEDYLMTQTKAAGVDKDLDYSSILATVLNNYQLLVHRGKWPAANNRRDRGAAPPSFGASAVHLSEANALVENLSHIKSRRPLRPHTGRPKRFDKPGSGSSATVKTSNKSGTNAAKRSKSNGKPKANWKQVPPGTGDSHTKTDPSGKVWHWCGKCNFGKGRWTASHKTSEHGQRPPNASPMANLAGIGPCAWHAPINTGLYALLQGLWYATFAPWITAANLALKACYTLGLPLCLFGPVGVVMFLQRRDSYWNLLTPILRLYLVFVMTLSFLMCKRRTTPRPRPRRRSRPHLGKCTDVSYL